ncbi:MAG: hypothetical protein L3J82_10190 [Planctomycetes bacterium]|nr:hypothetical protein [Planctomycetota bacterium]
MSKLLTLLLVLPLMLAGCYYEEAEDEFIIINEIPAGGLDWGLMNDFEHDYAQAGISSSTDQDGFTFSLNLDSVIVISVLGGGNVDAFLDLYDTNFSFVVGDNDGGPGNDPLLVGSVSAGDYFVVVGGEGGSTGNYDIDISIEPLGGADFEVLNIPSTNIDNAGDITDPADVDSYIFTLEATASIDIFLTRFNGNYDGNLELIDEFGNQIAFVDPVGDADPSILAQVLSAGTYIVRAGATTGNGAYDIQIDAT